MGLLHRNPIYFRGENDKAPRVYLGALNLFILRREQDSLLPQKL